MKQDIAIMVRGAVELSNLVSQSHYDEKVLRLCDNGFRK
jgi:hypothetical protein